MRGAFAGSLLVLATLAGACGEPVSAPAAREAALAIAPRWPAAVMANAVFGADIDSVYVIAYRGNESTAAERTVPFPRGQEGIRFSLNVPLLQRVETVYVYVEMREGATTTFYGYGDAVVLRAGAIPAVPAIPLQYVGLGYDAASLTISPTGGRIAPSDTVFFTTTALNFQQQPVTPPIAWSLSDSTLAVINASGRFIAGSRLGTLLVVATTPTGVADTVTVDIAPIIP